MTNLKLIDNVFSGERIKPEKLLKKLNKGIILKSFYLVVLNNSRLEILSSYLFLQNYYKRMELEVAAVLESYEDALEYIRCVTQILNSNNNIDFLKVRDINPDSIYALYYKEEL